LRHRRLVDADIAQSPSRWRLVARLGLMAVILTGGASAVIAFRQFPVADIWRDLTPSWTQLDWLASTMGSQQAIPKLRVESSRGVSGEPVQLALAIEGSAQGTIVTITGLLPGMEISTGSEVAAHKWQLLPEDVPYAFVAPPEKFVGSVGLIAELRLANDNLVDRQPLYLEWAPASAPGLAKNQYNREERGGPNRPVEGDSDREKAAETPSSTSVAPGRPLSSPLGAVDPNSTKSTAVPSSPPLAQNQVGRQEAMALATTNANKPVDQNLPVTESGPPAIAQRRLDPEEISVLLKRGEDFIAQGDIAAARVTLRRAAEANNAEAALALASIYDPSVLRELKVYGPPADAAMARAWYERAKELGSPVAPRRLEMLTRETR
jgi:hypothetical protein